MARIGSEDSGGELLVADLYAPPGAASLLAAEHYHPAVEEYFTVVRGLVGFRLDGVESVVGAGERVEVSPGIPHYWWNAGRGELHLIVEVRPASARYEEMVVSLFSLGREWRTDPEVTNDPTLPHLFAREFEDVVVFSVPSRMSDRSVGSADTGGLQGQPHQNMGESNE